MRSWSIYFGCVVVAGCVRAADEEPAAPPDPPPLDIEAARAALTARIKASPDQFGPYGQPDPLEVLRKARAERVGEDGRFHLSVGDKDRPFPLGFHINLKARTYEARLYAPVGRDDGKVRWYCAATWRGAFSFDTQLGKWTASEPTWTWSDAPKPQ
jgi:hypothetical protein